jgi:hypothetical protein
MSAWRITTIDHEASQEVAFLFRQEDVKHEIRRILKLLAAQADPRKPPKSIGLIVDRMNYDAPGWFRVKVPRYAIRIVFRLMIAMDEAAVEIKAGEPIPEEAAERYIDITHAAYRKDAYGEKLRQRFRRMRGDD